MGASVVIFCSLLFLSAGPVALAWLMAYRLVPETEQPEIQRRLIRWSVKGLAIPFLLWILMNLHLSWRFQPFMPQVQAARNSGGAWFPDFLEVLGYGALMIGSYWTAVTLGWFLASAAQAAEPEPRKDFRVFCRNCLLGLSIPAVMVLLMGGWPWVGIAGVILLGPIAGYAPAYLNPKKLPPMYARAIARMKFGKYTEAEWEIIRELERCEEDFEGWMMLAELYAQHFHDLAGAERTVLELCDQPTTNASQLSVALHRLADWHLKLGRNPVNARWALRMITERLEGTHLARMAHLRMDQLPETAEELKEQQNAAPIPLPALGDTLDRTPDGAKPKLERRHAAQLANACVEKLKRNPDNVAAREKLARTFAEQLDRADLGIEQMNLLLGLSGQAAARRAEWLGLTAAWHLKYRHDRAAGRSLLQRLVKEYPESAQALAARYRLEQMERELRREAQATGPSNT